MQQPFIRVKDICRKINWGNASFLALTHVLGIAGIIYIAINFSWYTLCLFFAMYLIYSISVTAGYHRLFSHKAYECAPWLQVFFAFFGAGNFLNSIIKWASDHRIHHIYVDTPKDPYNIKQGFWYAHIGWILMKKKKQDLSLPLFRDLIQNKVVRWQNRYYVLLGIISGLALPTLTATIWMDPIGGFLVAGFSRLTVQYHAIGMVNSVAHYYGEQPHGLSSSARQNTIWSFLLSLFTLGESYHNWHHEYPADYRNGVRPFEFDPTKWFIWLLSLFGVTYRLKTFQPTT